MKVLRLGTYHYPEITAASHLMDDLYKGFSDKNIEISLYVPMPSRGVTDEERKKYLKRKHEKTYDGKVIVHRFAMIKEGKNPIQKGIRYLLCNLCEFFLGIKEEDVDVVFCSSTPPTQGVVCALVAKRLSKRYGKKVPFVYNLQDIFPDSLLTTGFAKKDGLLWKIGRRIEDFTYKNADRIIVISEGFKRNIMEKGVPEEKIEIISNWIDMDSVYPVERNDNRLFEKFGLDPNKFIVVYAGNFGAAQGADIVLRAAEELKEINSIQFVIFGGGAYFEEAKKDAEKLDNVFIHELMPQSRISEVYSLGDVALITCKKGTGKAGMPSKTWSIMACNTPIIASFDTDSDLADVIRNSGAGKCVEPGDVRALTDAIERASKIKRNALGGRDLRRYVSENASKQACVNEYIDLIKSTTQNMVVSNEL